MRELPLVLQLDVAGNPTHWITYEKAAYYATKGLIAWSMQENDFTLFGGTSRMTGTQSTLTLDTIIAIRGKVSEKQIARNSRVPLTNRTLFRRDQNLCAYCGKVFKTSNLSRDHVQPASKGGPNVWTNVVTSCHGCNKYKDDKTLDEARMSLLYIPYTPSRSEYLILQNRRVLADQMNFLMARVPKGSRLLETA